MTNLLRPNLSVFSRLTSSSLPQSRAFGAGAHNPFRIAWSQTPGALAKGLDIFVLATIRHE
jgi:hypothetical protein